MKKTILTILLAAAATLSSSAQDIFDNPDNHPFLGIRASYELACPADIKVDDNITKLNLFNNGSGFSIGAIYNIPLWKNLYFEPGAAIYYNTYSLNRSLLQLAGPEFNGVSARQWGLRIPLNFGYNFDFTPDIRIAFFTGPEINISFKGTLHGSGTLDSSTDFTTNEPLFGSDGIMNRADIKWRFGVGATFADHYYLALSGAAGMCNLIRSDVVTTDATGFPNELGMKMHSNLFSLTLGYNF